MAANQRCTSPYLVVLLQLSWRWPWGGRDVGGVGGVVVVDGSAVGFNRKAECRGQAEADAITQLEFSAQDRPQVEGTNGGNKRIKYLE